MPTLRLACLLTALLLFLNAPVFAASPVVEVKDLEKPVAADSPTTYAGLLKLIFPEKAAGEEMTPQTPPAWSLGDLFKKQPLTAQRGARAPQALPIKSQGRTLLLLLVEARGKAPMGKDGAKEQQAKDEFHFHLLALFETTPAPRLLDLVDIGNWTPEGNTDERFWWSANPLIDLTPATQACLVYQEHTPSECFQEINLLWVRNDRLEKILAVTTYKDPIDPWEPDAHAAFRTEPDKDREFPKVAAQVTLKVEPSVDREKGFTRSYQGVWRWDPANKKYGQTSGNLDQLDKFYKEIIAKQTAREKRHWGDPIGARVLLGDEDLQKPVAPGSAVTHADLLQLIFPEKAAGEEMTPKTPPVWSLSGEFKKQPLTARKSGTVFAALPLKVQGQTLLLLTVEATGEDPEESEAGGMFELLALFKTTPAPKLLDLVDLRQQAQPFAGFWTEDEKDPLIDLTPTTQAFMVYQGHNIAGASFQEIYLLWVHHERLQKILEVSRENEQSGWEASKTWSYFRAEPDPGREFPKVAAKMVLRVKPAPDRDKEDPHPVRNFTRSYQGVWRWDPAQKKYRQASGNLDKLYKWYKKDY